MGEKTRKYLFNISALLLLGGALLYLTKWIMAPYLFAVGAAGIALFHLTTSTQDMNFRRRRLQRFNIIAAALMVAASAFMFMNRTEWILCLTIAAVFQAYTAFVSSDR